MTALHRASQLESNPLPVRTFCERTTLTDGHTRAFHLHALGFDGVPVAWDGGDLDDDAYEICVSWCREADVDAVPAMPVVNESRYSTEWYERCDRMQRRLQGLRESWDVLATPHYTFHFPRNSYAARNVSAIAAQQECEHALILRFLGATDEGTPPIRYVLCETRDDVGFFAGEDIPLCGFARSSKAQIFAVVNERERCLGPHEDAHVLAARHWGRPPQAFVRESLAMHFDETWNGKPVVALAARGAREGGLVPFELLFDNARFFECDCNVTYPIAGAFAAFIMDAFGREGYRSLYGTLGGDARQSVQETLGVSFEALESRFSSWLMTVA